MDLFEDPFQVFKDIFADVSAFGEFDVPKPRNTPGLADFHLRSALKGVDVKKLREGKGRRQQRQDVLVFKTEFGNPDFEEGDPTILLGKFLREGNKILPDQVREDELFKTIESRTEISIEIVKRRIEMELNRMTQNLGSSSSSLISKQGLRYSILKSFKEHSSKGYYQDLRCFTDCMLILSNNINSMRSYPTDLNFDKSGLFYAVKDPHNEAELMGIVAYLNGVVIFVGGSLLFFQIFEITKVSEEEDDLIGTQPSLSRHALKSLEESIIDRWQCVSIDNLKMICDKVSERDIILRCCKLYSPVLPEVYLPERLIRRLFTIGDIWLSLKGNTSYKLFKVYESLAIGVILSRCSCKITDNTEFLRSTIDDFSKDNPELKCGVAMFVSFFNSLKSPHHLSQIYGLFRIWGHPLVSSQEGLAKVRKLGKAIKPVILEKDSMMAGRFFKQGFFMNYYKSNSCYPSFSIINTEESEDILEEDYLLACLVSGSEIKKNSDEYRILSWDKVQVEKTFEIPETFNLTMVIDDKAISPDKEFLIKVANKEERLMNPYERRGVLKWMNMDYRNCIEFLQKINDCSLDDKDCVIGLYPKERELNSTPRMFSLMSCEMRNYVVVTEHMIADDLLPYFPQITMTNDLLGLTKKIYSATREQKASSELEGSKAKLTGSLEICINMDFEKWNLNMRKESTYHVFLEMGRLYGMPELFNRTYDIFRSSYVYLSDGSGDICVEKDPTTGLDKLFTDDLNSYTGHIGGFEGLRQKGWTIFTVVVIQMILEKYPTTYKLMGQGDNQVLMLKLSTALVDVNGGITNEGYHEMKIMLNLILSDLDNTFRLLGLPLKTLESWKSEEFFLYGKYPVLNGVPLCMSLKKICRAFPFSNEDTMSFDNVFSAIFANAQAASMSDVSHLMSYYQGLYEAATGAHTMVVYNPMLGKSFKDLCKEGKYWVHFEQNHATGRNTRIRREFRIDRSLESFVEGLCLIPKSLGGTNAITEYEFVMRGFPDNQTRDFTYLQELLTANLRKPHLSEITSIMIHAMNIPISKNLNLDFLIEDPCALNILQPDTPTTVLRKKVKKTLAENTTFKNRNFAELFSLTNDDRKKNLLRSLAAGDKLFPRLLHDCYSASLFGFVDGIVSKVDRTITVQRISLEQSSEDIMTHVMGVEANYIRYLFWRMSATTHENNDTGPGWKCPTNYIRWVRNTGWKKEVLGVTVPFPSHTLLLPPDDHAMQCREDLGDNYITCTISDYVPNNQVGLLNTIGKSPPYLGSKTKEKVKTFERIALYSSEPLISRIIKLIRVLNWGRLGESNLSDFAYNVLSSVSDIDGSSFLVSEDDIGGSIEHRYKDSALKHGALLSSLYGLSTWTHVCTDSLSKYSKGGKNVTLHFQAMICWIQSIMYELLLAKTKISRNSEKEFHFHLHCEECIVPVDYEVPDIEPIEKSLIPELKENPYCYVKNVTLTNKESARRRLEGEIKYNLDRPLDTFLPHEKYLLFHSYWADEIYSDLIQAEIDFSSFGTNIMEFSRYPRIAFRRLNPKCVLEILHDMLLFNQMRVFCLRDKYNECVVKLGKINSILVNEMKKKSPSSFIGLAMLFTWPEKLRQLYDISPTSIIRSKTPSIEDLVAAGKSLLITFMKNRDLCFVKTERCLNAANPSPVLQQLELSIFKRKQCDLMSCQCCLKWFFQHFASIKEEGVIVPQIEELPECKHMILSSKLISKFQVVFYPEDILSKATESVAALTTRMIEQTISSKQEKDIGDHLDYLIISKQKYQILKSIKRIPEELGSIGASANYSFSKDQMNHSILYRVANNDLSSCYRILEWCMYSDQSVERNVDKLVVIGDGIGNSSYIFNRFLKVPTFSSTLLDCSATFPQLFPSWVDPNRFLLGDDDEANDNILEKISVCNIFDQDWIKKLNELIKKKDATMVFCDIELEHTDSIKSNIASEYAVIQSLWELNVDKVSMRWRFENTLEVRAMINACAGLFRTVKVFSTPFCNPSKCEVFIDLRDRYEEVDECGISERTISRVIAKLNKYTLHNVFDSLSGMYYRALNEVLVDDQLRAIFASNLDSFLSKSDFEVKFDKNNFAKLFTSINSNFSPRIVANRHDNLSKYVTTQKAANLFSIMMIGGLMQIKQDSVVMYILQHLHEYGLYQVIKKKEILGRHSLRDVSFSTCIFHQSRVEELSERFNFGNNLCPLINGNDVKRFLPYVRCMYMLDNFEDMIDLRRMDSIQFRYDTKPKSNSVSLKISKTLGETSFSIF